MITRFFLLVGLLLTSLNTIAQDDQLLSSLTIPVELKENANAIIRFEDTHIVINAYNRMVYSNKRIVTILNSSADSKHGAYVNYDKGISIKKLEARIYNSFGKEIKKVRKGDFEDVSAVDGGTLYSDSRVKYLNYTPTDYPYTVVFETEIEYSSTAFLPQWQPIEGFYTSTQYSNYKITNNSNIEIKFKTVNFEDYDIEKLNEFNYSAQNLMALKPESYSPPIDTFAPFLSATLEDFNYEGYKGKTSDWKNLGKWMYEQLLVGRTEVSETTKNEVNKLVEGINDPIERAKIVYEYVQNNTRYISVQEGIGGIQPIDAFKVDQVKYGDCKGLSNYTKALLDVVGVESYYTRVYASPSRLVNIDKDFVSFVGQTNHVIINIPNQGNDIWLECTSQTSPFGYNANFTDDRDVFVITPQGGKIVHTKVYVTEENLVSSKARVTLDETGNMQANLILKSYGSQYGQHEGIQNQTQKDQELYFKRYWSYINGLDIENIAYQNDKDIIEFTENLNLKAEHYAAKTGERLLLQPNLFNRIETAPKRYVDRALPFQLERGETAIDEYVIIIPDTMEVEALMDAVNIKNRFGEYTVEIIQHDNNKLTYKRKFVLNKGTYEKEDYETFRNFWLDVVKNDKSKIVLKSKS